MKMSRLQLRLSRSLFHMHIHRMGSDVFIITVLNLFLPFLFILDFKFNVVLLRCFYFTSALLFSLFFYLFVICFALSL
jgi:hypothetical protein